MRCGVMRQVRTPKDGGALFDNNLLGDGGPPTNAHGRLEAMSQSSKTVFDDTNVARVLLYVDESEVASASAYLQFEFFFSVEGQQRE